MIQALLNYQTADAKLKEIEKKLAESGAKAKALSAKKYLAGVEENVNKLDARAEELKSVFEKTLIDQAKLNEQSEEISEALESATDEKEVQYLIKKADELIKKTKEIEALANKLSEEIQAVIKNYASIKKTTEAAKAQYKENYDKYKELEDSVKEEKESVEKELEELKSKVDASLMERYLKKRANKMYPVIYEVNGGNCRACGLELPMSVMNKLKNGEVIDCEQCGKMIYMPKK